MINPYQPKDYEGDYNLLKSEKALIQKAYTRANGNLKKMSKLLERTERQTLIAIVRHFTSLIPSIS
jgi:hypothetical protein